MLVIKIIKVHHKSPLERLKVGLTNFPAHCSKTMIRTMFDCLICKSKAQQQAAAAAIFI